MHASTIAGFYGEVGYIGRLQNLSYQNKQTWFFQRRRMQLSDWLETWTVGNALNMTVREKCVAEKPSWTPACQVNICCFKIWPLILARLLQSNSAPLGPLLREKRLWNLDHAGPRNISLLWGFNSTGPHWKGLAQCSSIAGSWPYSGSWRWFWALDLQDIKFKFKAGTFLHEY